MSSALSAPAASVAVGAQQPRIRHVPEYAATSGHEAVELAASAGLEMDPWQADVLIHALGERADGQWAAFEVGVEVPRQNGKGGILEARALAGLFLLDEELIIHSAHEFATAEEALERMANIFEGSPDLSRHLKKNGIKRSHGQEGIYLKTGQRLRYKTRTKGGGRGFSADCVILDEAMVIPEAMHGALMPTLSAMPNPQLWYTGSAVDQNTMEHGVVFSRVRERALKGDDPALAYFGWSPAFDKPADIPPSVAADPETWALGNPALGIRITEEHIAKEHRAMDPRTFAVERLGVGDWPRVSEQDGSVISIRSWLSLVDADSAIADKLVFVFDVSPDRQSACVAAVGKRDDGLTHPEVMEHKRGTGWLADYLEEKAAEHQPSAVFYAEKSPAASLASEIKGRGVKLKPITETDHAKACGTFYDAVDQRTIRHLGTNEMLTALKGATTRSLAGAWAWDRPKSNVDITPLVCFTLGTWAVDNKVRSQLPMVAFA